MNILDLLDGLNNESSWRKKELAQARFLALKQGNEIYRPYLSRSWVLIMYAHCDSFLKESVKIYLKYIKHNIEEVTYRPDLMWLISNKLDKKKDNYKSLEEYGDTKKHVYFDDICSNDILSNRSIQYENLRFLCDWVIQVKYDHVAFRTFLKTLIKKRNDIAHGKASYIKRPDDCQKWHDETIAFMETLKEAIITRAKDDANQ